MAMVNIFLESMPDKKMFSYHYVDIVKPKKNPVLTYIEIKGNISIKKEVAYGKFSIYRG